MSLTVPQGFRFAGVHAGIKRNTSRQDVSLVVSDRAAAAAGVYTKNLVFAAPVEFDRPARRGKDFAPSSLIPAMPTLVPASGAWRRGRNGAIGGGGMRCPARSVLVLSTGIIGEFLPMDKIAGGIRDCSKQLGTNEEALVAAARGMMTTDTTHKLAGRSVHIGAVTSNHRHGKGAAMIGPNMGTMLGLVLTDAPIAAGRFANAFERGRGRHV